MDRQQDNRSKQMNPEHKPSGPGRHASYPGDQSKPNIDNHADQKNPNNAKYQGKK